MGTWLKMASQIKLAPQAKAHFLFPLLDYLVKTVHTQQNKLESIGNRLTKIESDVSTVVEMQKDLRKLMKEYGESSFNIEKTPYQVSFLIPSS